VKVKKIDLVLLNCDKTPVEIFAITGISVPMVYVYLAKLGIKPVKVTKRNSLPTADELKAEGLSQKKLAVKYGVSIGTIKLRMKQWKQ
jgi:DNA-binding CsgD family transcriptional regulator